MKYTITIHYNTWYPDLGNFYQAFVRPTDELFHYLNGTKNHCLGKTVALGAFNLDHPEHYKAKTNREIVGTMKRLFKNIKRIPTRGDYVSSWEGEL